MDELTIFAATFILVFMRGIQQQNVIHGNYKMAFFTPYAIACGEVSSVLLVVAHGWWSIPFVGTGGAVGIVLSMYVHKRWRLNKSDR